MSAILVEIQDSIGTITLNRPEKHNAFDDVLIAALTGTLKELEHHNKVRIVVLSAAGKSFSAGADVNWMKRMATYSEADNFSDAMALGQLMRTLHGLSKPTIARVHGAAYGGGVGLVACCDIAVAGKNAVFSISEARLGLVPAVISPYVIAAIGERMARRYFLTAERFDAAEAFRIGLVHELATDDDQLDRAVARIVEALLAAGPRSQAKAKALIDAVSNRPLSDQLVEETAQRIARIRVSPEGQEGLGAFLEKRDPNWLPHK